MTDRRLADPSIRALNDEWHALVAGSDEAVARWRQHPEFIACRTLDDVLGRAREDPDPVLGRLLVLRAAGESLAGRVVLQALLGPIVLAARRTGRPCHEFLAELWCRICTYPVHRRRHGIAASLVLDTRKAVRTAGRAAIAFDPAQLDLLSAPERSAGAGVAPTAADVLAAARSLGLIDDRTRDTLTAVYREGLASAEAAASLGSTPTAVRWRNSWALRRLAAHATLLRDAA